MARIGKALRSLEGGLVAFWCPGCDGMHSVGVKHPAQVVWGWNGDGDKPTFTPSVLVRSGRGANVCHSYVTDGRIRFLSDCTHELAGQTVDLPDVDQC